MAAADGRRGRTFQPHARHFERSENVVGNQRSVQYQGALAGIDALPFDGHSCCVYGARGGFGNFGSDAVSGDKRNLMSHHRYYKGG
jgi:hypothetical protein